MGWVGAPVEYVDFFFIGDRGLTPVSTEIMSVRDCSQFDLC